MAKILLITIIACLPFRSFSQTIHSWPDKNSWWGLEYHTVNQGWLGDFLYYYLDGDTLIGGNTYQKVSNFQPVGNFYVYTCATREDSSNRVWIVPRDSVNEILLYDFDVQVGDTIHDVYDVRFATTGARVDLRVNSKQIYNGYGDGSHIAIWLDEIGGFGEGFWLDGIGESRNPFFTQYGQHQYADYYSNCMVRDNLIVNAGHCGAALPAEDINEIKFDLYPNPTNGVLRIGFQGIHSVRSLHLTDLQGRELKHWDKVPAEIDLAGWPAGLYLLTFSGPGFRQTEKISLTR